MRKIFVLAVSRLRPRERRRYCHDSRRQARPRGLR